MKVAVVGGGLAGLAAALDLVDAGAEVTLYEARPTLGGKVQTLPARHHPALSEELGLLDRDIERHFTYPEDLMLARIADAQGLGGHSGTIKR